MTQISRRTTFLGLTGLYACAALPVFSQRRPQGFTFVFEIDGTRFGAVATIGQRGQTLLTVRSMDNRMRVATMIRRPQQGSSQVTITGAGREVSVSSAGNEPRISGGGVTFLGGSPHPGDGGGAPQTFGFFNNVINAVGNAIGAIGDLLEIIGIGIAAGLAWLVGAQFSIRFWDGRGEIWVERDGSIIMGYDGSGFMPPPEGTEEMPGVWY